MDSSPPDPQPGQGTPDTVVKPKRSFLAGWVILALLAAGFLVMASRHLIARIRAEIVQDTAAPVANVPPPTTALSLPRYGVTLNTPPQWHQVPPDRSNIAARWISPSSRAESVSGAVMIEVAKPSILDVKRIATSLAGKWHGELVDKPDSLGGEPAYRIVASVTEELQPVEGLVCIHEGRLYLLEGDVTDGHACHDQIETIRQGWAWMPLDPSAKIDPPDQLDPLAQLDSPLDVPVKHLEFRYQPITIFKGKVSINFPAAMRVSDDGFPEDRIILSLHNNQHDHAEFLAVVQSGEIAPGDTLKRLEERLGAASRAKFQSSDAFVWHKLKSDSARGGMTQPLPALGWEQCWIMWAIVVLPDNKLVLINFAIYAEDRDDRAFYAQTAERIVETVQLSIEGNRDLEKRKIPLHHSQMTALPSGRGSDFRVLGSDETWSNRLQGGL